MTISPVTTQQQHNDFEHRSSVYMGTSCNVEQLVNKEFKWLHLFLIQQERVLMITMYVILYVFSILLIYLPATSTTDLRKLNSQVNLNPSKELFMYHSDSSIIN